ncbi:MAG: septum formation initiator family protein [Synergistaceae bacterium]|nr:septum formation initiator family protein [Synergistaceae bacterium]MBQ6435387.1 septum formation initiator family protein [Synergistaceae bacterium]MBQ6737394.1 septum formation initiator family protein [Synergistaceae bacterium]MBQ7067743.1 septum formation initiator family protein [Synergistaceae bacterium]MBR0074196.1 septum formation initiator family protein [Synergistaceae bacterium]
MLSLKRVILITILLVIFAIAAGCYKFEYDRILSIQDAIRKREAELASKRNSVQEYREKVSFYKTDEGAEHLAREQYNLVREGESVFLLRSEDKEPEF